MTEKLSVPQVLSITELKRQTAKIFANGLKQSLAQHWWTSRTGNLLQSCKTALLKATHPVLNRASTASEELCHLGTTEAAADQKYAMQPVVISRLLGSHNFILYCKPNDLCIFDLKLAHGSLLPVSTIPKGSIIRNYI